MRNYITIILAVAGLLLFNTNVFAGSDYASKSSHIITKKTAKYNNDGSYTLTLETFVNGYKSNTISHETKNIPLDVVLVLDVSGSMTNNINSNEDIYTERSRQAYTFNTYGDNTYYISVDNKYYVVKRESNTIDESYSPIQGEYSYNSIYGKNDYYYTPDKGQHYYKVYTKQQVNNYCKLCYDVNGTTYYLWGSSSSTDDHWGQRKKPGDTIYTGTLWKLTEEKEYLLTYTTEDNSKYYLSGTTASTIPASVNTDSKTIWTGVLYTKSTKTTTQTKLAALKSAVKSFVENIEAQSTAEATHRVAIVKFAGDKSTDISANGSQNNYRTNSNDGPYNSQLSQIAVKLEAGFPSVYDAISKLTADGATHSDYGMQLAEGIINDIPTTRNSNKLVVMFTDGQPTSSNNFENTVANGAISSAKNMKDKGAIVYTVGVFSNSDASNENVQKYMNYVSSNYAEAQSMNVYGTKSYSKYFMTAQSSQELNNIFATINDDINHWSEDNAGIDLPMDKTTKEDGTVTTKTYISDIVTPSFVVPSDTDAKKSVRIFTIDATGATKTSNWNGNDPTYSSYTWSETKTEVNPEDVWAILTPETRTIDGTTATYTKVDVHGFDFSNNWVGLIEEFDEGSNTPKGEPGINGKKLIIEIDIMPNPEAIGGEVSTNTTDSGLYVDGEFIPGTVGGAVVNYQVPGALYTPMDLKITKEWKDADGNSLNENVTSIFKVTRDGDDFEIYVALDPKNPTKSIAKVDVVKNPDPLETNKEFFVYTVEEMPWSWTYAPDQKDGKITKALYKEDGTAQNVFEFTNTRNREKTQKNSEAKVNNTFTKVQ